jgi:FKBP-type peptidyl-prolyl cis-trans isomerase
VSPSALAYGQSGTPDGSVQPDETLVFVVDLIEQVAAS